MVNCPMCNAVIDVDEDEPKVLLDGVAADPQHRRRAPQRRQGAERVEISGAKRVMRSALAAVRRTSWATAAPQGLMGAAVGLSTWCSGKRTRRFRPARTCHRRIRRIVRAQPAQA